MASIVFDYIARTKQFDDPIKESRQKVGEFVKDVQSGTERIDKSFDKMGTSAKQAITQQKQLIKEIEADVRKLQKAIEEATPGKAKRNLVEELKAAKRALAEEQGTLLGMQNQQMQANEKEVGTHNKLISSLGKWAAGLFTAGLALKVFKGVMNSTEATQVKFEQLVSGAKAAVQYFYRALASGDFKDFISGMGQAVKAASDFVKQMDEINNLRNEAAIKESEDELRVRELREKTYDRDDANNSQRRAALIEMMSLEERIYERRKEINQKILDSTLARVSKQLNISETEIKNLIKEYSSLEALIKVGEEYNRLTKAKNFAQDPVTLQNLLSERDALGENAEQAGEYVKRIGKIGMETRNEITRAWTTLINEEGEYYQKTRRYGTQLAAVNKEIWDAYMKEIEESNNEADRMKDPQYRLNKYTKELTEAISKGDQQDIKNLSLKVTTLQRELDIREKILSNIKEAANRDLSPISRAYVPNSPTSEGTGVFTASGLYDWEKFNQMADQTKQNLRDELALRQEIANTIQEGAYQLAGMLNITEDAVKELNSVVSLVGDIARQDYLSMASDALSLIDSILASQETSFNWFFERLDVFLEKYDRLMEKTQRFGGGDQFYDDYLKGLQDQITATDVMLEKARYKERHSTILNEEKRKQDVKDLEARKKELEAIYEDAKLEYQDLLSGGITQNTIADAVADGFIEGGKYGVDTVADYMNNVLRNAATDVFKQSILSDPVMQEYIDMAKSAFEGGVLTPEEKEKLDKMGEKIGETFQPLWDSLMSGFKDIGTPGGLSGAIRSLTEDTGSELAGILRGIRDDVRSSRDIDRMATTHLAMIEANTRETADNTKETCRKLDTIISNTKPTYAGDL